MKNIFAAILLVALSGCVNVPKTAIEVPTARGIVRIKAPKDSTIEGLQADFEKGKVSIEKYQARMNPEVVSASAAGTVEIIRAYGELANRMAELGLKGLAASQGIPVATSQQPVQTTTITPEQLSALIQKRAEEILKEKKTGTTNQP